VHQSKVPFITERPPELETIKKTPCFNQQEKNEKVRTAREASAGYCLRLKIRSNLAMQLDTDVTEGGSKKSLVAKRVRKPQGPE